MALPFTQTIGKAVGAAGHILGLPEFGISEAIQDPRRSVLSASPNNTTLLTNSPSPTGQTYSPSSSGTGGVLGATTVSDPTADPYAQWGGEAAFNDLQSKINAQRQNIFGTANEAIGQAGNSLRGGILDFLDSLRSGQRGIDAQAVQNELARKQGTQGVLGMVGRGIQSGGVTLANRNASDSSASQALANAYGDLGRRELSNVGNQYAQGQNSLEQSQADLMDQQSQGVRHLQESKNQVVNNIVTNARNSLAALDASITGASLPDQINIEQEKERIKNQALAQLQQYDQLLTQGISGIQASSPQARQAQAAQLANAGVAPDNAFSFSDQTPATFQGTGPFPSQLPLFQSPRNRRTA